MQISQESWNGYYNSYFFGEAKGAELIRRLVDFSPGEQELMWVKVWAAEEELHHRLWAEVVEKKKIPIKKMEDTIAGLFRVTEDFVNKKDWTGSMVGATIIEHLSSTAAHFLYNHADEDTRRIFRKITGDDLGHLNFDLAQLEKIAQTKEGRKKIIDCHKKFLEEILKWPLRKNLLDGEMEILNETYELHRRRMEKIGVKLPRIKFSNSLSFKLTSAFIKLLAKV